jgi:hypothetical protein
VAGTGIEVAPVLAIEGIAEWGEPGPVTRAAIAATGELIRRDLATAPPVGAVTSAGS